MKQRPTLNRRQFTSGSAAALGTLCAAPHLVAQATAPQHPDTLKTIPTRDTVAKFYPNGQPKHFAGNTIICHVQQEGALRDSLVQLNKALASSSYAKKLGILPQHSYHMTVFPGANDQDRETTGWPSYVPANAPIAECNRLVLERMRGFRLDCSLPLRMTVGLEETVTFGRAATLRLFPADAAEETKIRRLRDRLVEPYGFTDKGHDTYTFHISLAYELTRLTDGERRDYQAMLRTHVTALIAATPAIEFGNPEYCTFPDMFRFDTQLLLET
jgi:hypothetical protein